MVIRFLLIACFFLPGILLFSQGVIQMPGLNNSQLLEEELARRGPGIAPQFAHPFEVSLTPAVHGTWELFGEDKAVWTLKIVSTSAYSINLAFTEVHFPPSASLFLSGNATGEIFGPFGEAFNRTYHELWTPIIGGDEVTVYLSVHLSEMEDLSLVISQVNHDYLNFRGALSGSCNLDVICGASDGWPIVDNYRDIIQSVAVISTGGSTFCTGFLVNNANNDCTPYFMTARHCGINNNPGSLVTYWNYYNSFCRQPNTSASGAPGNGVLTDFNTGSVLRASYQPSDFTLVELSDPVSETADAFYAGWDATTANPDTSIAVHHPNTDEKRISFDFNPGTTTNYLESAINSNGTHIRVGNWEIGTTEGGSSGSPLFNQHSRVVGQLHGGYASCSSITDDWYGRISVSWIGGGTPATSLKHWLDPGNTGVLAIDGRYQTACNFGFEPALAMVEICAPGSVSVSLQVSENFQNTASLSHSALPAGLTFTNFPTTGQPGVNITFNVNATAAVSSGIYEIEITAAQGDDSGIATLQIGVSNGIPSMVNLVSPVQNLQNAPVSMDFNWEAFSGVVSYDLQVSTVASFSTQVVDVTGLSATEYNAVFNPLTTYYWRVRAQNICGTGPWSAVRQFTTSEIACIVQTSTNVPITIGSGQPNTINSTIAISQEGVVSDVSILNVSGIHTYMSDLVFNLISPQGTTVTLMANVCGSQQNFDIGFSDTGLSGPVPCPPIDGNVYQPDGSFADFIGQNVEGNWTLQIQDQAFLDGGILQNWELEICYNPTEDHQIYSDLLTNSDDPMVCKLTNTATFDVELGSGFGAQTTLAATFPGGSPVTATFNPTTAAGGETIQVTLNNFSSVPAGLFSFSLTADDGETSETFNAQLHLQDAPTQVVMLSPTDNSMITGTAVQFTWATLPLHHNAFLQIDHETGNFSNPLHNIPITGAQHSLNQLEFGNYQWRIRTENTCGLQENPEIWSFEYLSTASQNPLLDKIKLLPNPAHDVLSFDFGQIHFEQVSVSVLDLQGKQIIAPQILRENGIIISDLPAGMYYIRMDTEYGSTTWPFVRQ